MAPRGAYKFASRNRAFEAYLDPEVRRARRVRRILDSIRDQIVSGGEQSELRIRRVFKTPREVYRLELELPELGYQRTTLLDRAALEQLLEAEEIRSALERRASLR